MERNEVIVQIGGEGGDLTIYGVRTHAGWRFSQEVVDQSSLMLDGTTIQHASDVVDTWEEVLGLLGRYPWHRLYPLQVHPEFKERVLEAAKARYQADSIPDQYGGLKKWIEVCSMILAGSSQSSDLPGDLRTN